MVVKWCCEWAKIDILNYLIEQLDKKKQYPNVDTFYDFINWIDTSDKADEKQQKEALEIVKSWFSRVSPKGFAKWKKEKGR